MPVTLPTISDIVSNIESNNNQFALRFELKTFKDCGNSLDAKPILTRIQSTNGCSIITAQMIYSTSFGLYQLMGFNLYVDGGLYIPVGKFLNDKNAQDGMFYRYLKAHGLDKFTTEDLRDNADKRIEFASRYNGPGAVQDYARLIQQTIARLTVRVPDQFA